MGFNGFDVQVPHLPLYCFNMYISYYYIYFILLYFQYSSPPLVRSPYWSRNCGHIREVAFGEGKVNAFIAVAPQIGGHIRGGGLF